MDRKVMQLAVTAAGLLVQAALFAQFIPRLRRRIAAAGMGHGGRAHRRAAH